MKRISTKRQQALNVEKTEPDKIVYGVDASETVANGSCENEGVRPPQTAYEIQPFRTESGTKKALSLQISSELTRELIVKFVEILQFFWSARRS
jgi:hypothetical protein